MKPEAFVVFMIVCAFGLMHDSYKRIAFPCFIISLVLYMGWLPIISDLLIVKEKPAQIVAEIPTPELPKHEPENTQEYKEYIFKFWKKDKQIQVIPVSFFHAIVTHESGWRQFNRKGNVLTSTDGALGLFQVLPATAGDYGLTKADISKATGNIQAGMLHIKRLYKVFKGDFEKITMAYNLGEGNVHRKRKLGNKETVLYTQRVMGQFKGADYLYRECRQSYCLALKRNSGNAGRSHQGIYALIGIMQSSQKGWWRATSLKDKYHQRKYDETNGHNKGLAFDFTVRSGVNHKEVKTNLAKWLKAASNVKYKLKHYSSAKACNGCTGRHYHFEFLDRKSAQRFLDWAFKANKWGEEPQTIMVGGTAHEH